MLISTLLTLILLPGVLRLALAGYRVTEAAQPGAPGAEFGNSAGIELGAVGRQAANAS
jgi:hypothetical protein